MKRASRAILTKPQWAWAFSDWANSAYTTTVIAVFFPIFFKQYWAQGLDASDSTFFLGMANSFNSALLFLIAPFLGTLADFSGHKKIYLMAFTLLGAAALVPFFFIPAGGWQWALVFFTLSNVGYWVSLIFNDALLMNVSTEKDISFVSSAGYALGYLGGGVLIVANAWAVQDPAAFGLDSPAAAVRWSFLSVAVWWILFSLPLYFYVPETPGSRKKISLLKVFHEVISTIKKMRSHKPLFYFLLAYIFYIDGVNTIFKMAVDFALSIGLKSSDLILAIVLVQFIGFPATLGFAWLAKKIGDRRSLFVGLGVYFCATTYAYFVSTALEFYAMAVVIGLVQGGLQAISRAQFGRMVPKENAGEFFGIYNMVGKFSAVLGPLSIGLLSLWTHNPRISLSIVLLFFVIGGIFLKKAKS